MRKILLTLTMALCTIISANAQDFNNDYRYGFWSNWSLGAGAVYSKPMDITSWSFEQGANVGVDVRLEKQLSKWWTLRLDACIPGFIKEHGYDRYGTAMVGMNFNIGDSFYLFGDGGIAAKRFNIEDGNNNLWLTCDAGLGAKTRFSKHSAAYIEIGADCSSYLDKTLEHSMAYGKLGYLYSFGVTKKDREAIANMNNHEGYVAVSEYERLAVEKESCAKMLEETINEVNKMRNCCQSNNARYEKEINDLKEALANKKDTTIPFSVLFKKNSVELDATAKEIISQVAIEMKNDGGSYTLYGFGDYTGSEEYNENLSGSRCESVKKELVKNGVDEDKLNVVGLGKTKYFGTAESYVNRRVMFVKD